MPPIIDTDSGAVFTGSVDDDESVTAAAAIARGCTGFSADDDDECYVDKGGSNCFNCRGRRWVQDGFVCMKDLLRG
jgi:hypothetical protein